MKTPNTSQYLKTRNVEDGVFPLSKKISTPVQRNINEGLATQIVVQAALESTGSLLEMQIIYQHTGTTG